MDTFDISQLKPEDVRERPNPQMNPWLYQGLHPLFGILLYLALLFGFTTAGWGIAAMGLLLGLFQGWQEWQRGEKAWALRAALRRWSWRVPPWGFWLSLLGLCIAVVWSEVDASRASHGYLLLYIVAWWVGWSVPYSVLAFRAWPQAWRIIREVKARGTP